MKLLANARLQGGEQHIVACRSLVIPAGLKELVGGSA